MKTNSIKKVIIALDYDPTSKKVAEQGFAMAKALGAETSLLHVTVDMAVYSSAYADMGAWQMDTLNVFNTQEMRNAGSQNFLEKAKLHLGDTAIQTILKEGDPAQKYWRQLMKRKPIALLWVRIVRNGWRIFWLEVLPKKCYVKRIFRCLLCQQKKR